MSFWSQLVSILFAPCGKMPRKYATRFTHLAATGIQSRRDLSSDLNSTNTKKFSPYVCNYEIILSSKKHNTLTK